MENTAIWSDTDIHLIDIFVSSLEKVTNPPPHVKNLKMDIFSSGRDFKLANIGLESLAILELCINLEFDHSIVLSPENYLSFISVNDLLRGMSIR